MKRWLAEFRSLPKSFVRDMIMKAPGQDTMTFFPAVYWHSTPMTMIHGNISTENVLRRCLHLTTAFPMLADTAIVYQHFHCGQVW